MQDEDVSQAGTAHNPFIECYRAWMQEQQFSSATGADFLASFSSTSGALSPAAECVHSQCWLVSSSGRGDGVS